MAVVVYSTPTCPYCNLTKEFLKKNKISFRSVDVSQDEKAQAEMIKKSGQMHVPVIDANGTIILGFDEDKLRETLKIK